MILPYFRPPGLVRLSRTTVNKADGATKLDLDFSDLFVLGKTLTLCCTPQPARRSLYQNPLHFWAIIPGCGPACPYPPTLFSQTQSTQCVYVPQNKVFWAFFRAQIF